MQPSRTDKQTDSEWATGELKLSITVNNTYFEESGHILVHGLQLKQ
jgi:hypothetical protein